MKRWKLIIGSVSWLLTVVTFSMKKKMLVCKYASVYVFIYARAHATVWVSCCQENSYILQFKCKCIPLMEWSKTGFQVFQLCSFSQWWFMPPQHIATFVNTCVMCSVSTAEWNYPMNIQWVSERKAYKAEPEPDGEINASQEHSKMAQIIFEIHHSDLDL